MAPVFLALRSIGCIEARVYDRERWWSVGAERSEKIALPVGVNISSICGFRCALKSGNIAKRQIQLTAEEISLVVFQPPAGLWDLLPDHHLQDVHTPLNLVNHTGRVWSTVHGDSLDNRFNKVIFPFLRGFLNCLAVSFSWLCYHSL